MASLMFFDCNVMSVPKYTLHCCFLYHYPPYCTCPPRQLESLSLKVRQNSLILLTTRLFFPSSFSAFLATLSVSFQLSSVLIFPSHPSPFTIVTSHHNFVNFFFPFLHLLSYLWPQQPPPHLTHILPPSFVPVLFFSVQLFSFNRLPCH